MANEAFTNAVKQALRSSAAFGLGTSMEPRLSAIPKNSIRGVAPPPVTQWVLQGSDFEQKLAEQFNSISRGETRMLVAATGIGKTTIMPIRLAILANAGGLVLVPDDLVLSSVVRFVQEKPESVNGTVAIHALRSHHIDNPISGPVVYYCYARDFLPRFHAEPDMIQRLNLAFLYLDEAHTRDYVYYLLRIFVGVDFFKDTRVFLGTGTCPGNSLILTGSKNQVLSQPMSPASFPIDRPNDILPSSGASASAIVDRTLIFLATDLQVLTWEKYYDEHDICTYTMCSYDSSTKLEQIEKSLRNGKRPSVFLTTGKLETGPSFDVDTVICSGYKQVVEVDYSKPSVSLVIRTVTIEERKQRLGRVGRHLQGRAFYVDVKLHDTLPELDSNSALYVWMWARMFNLQLRNPEVAQFEELFGDCSNRFLSLMLCSRIHPVLISSYLTMEGELYQGWGILRQVFRTQRSIAVSTQDNERAISEWPVRNTGPREWLPAPAQFRSCAEFPSEWISLPLSAWSSYEVEGFEMDLLVDNMSVISALAPKQIVSRQKTTKSVSTSNGESSFQGRRRKAASVMTTGNSISPVGFRMPEIDFRYMPESKNRDSQTSVIQRAITVKSVKPDIEYDRLDYSHKRGTSNATEEIPRDDIGKWVETVSSPRNRRESRSSSDSSHDKNDMILYKVDPKKFAGFKLYPMEQSLLSQYLSNESVSSVDYSRMKSLLSLKKNFASLSSDTIRRIEAQQKYFLSVLRVHNCCVMERLQIHAGETDRPASFFSRMLNNREESNDAIITQSVNLLFGMQYESYFVGIDKRTRHSASSSEVSESEVSKIDSLSRVANYFLSVTDAQVNIDVFDVRNSVIGIKAKNRVIGSAWLIGKAVISIAHIFEDYDIAIPYSLIRSDSCDDFSIFRNVDFVSSHLTLRGPVQNEYALLAGFCPIQQQFRIVAYVRVFEIGNVWCLSDALSRGYSGFALISISDRACIGLYRGKYMSFPDGKEVGHFVPTNSFYEVLASIYL